MKTFVTAIFFLVLNSIFGQSIIEWSPDYVVKFEDFQAPRTEINDHLFTYSIVTGTDINLSLQMTSSQLMYTENFNPNVITTFNKSKAEILAPTKEIAMKLVQFGQYSFDLTELYARKFRKEIHEQKATISDISFFQPIHQKIQLELNAELNRVLRKTEFGRRSILLEEEHQKVLMGIEDLSDFCRECTLPK